jgi:hypothetical protein
MNWLEGLNVNEQFLADIAESIPEKPASNTRFVFMVDNSQFRKASDTYMAKIENAQGPIFQLYWEGRNVDRGWDSEPTSYSPIQANLGNGWNLTEEGDVGLEVAHEEHTRFAGSTQYGKLIRALSDKFGVTSDNYEKFQEETPNGEIVTFGPEFRRLMRWFVKRNGCAPDWRKSEHWNGVGIQFDGVMETDRNGKEVERRQPIGIACLEGETEEEFAWYENYLKSLGLELPWYVMKPGESVKDRNERIGGEPEKAGAKPATTPANKAKPSTAPKTTAKPAAAKTEPKAEPKADQKTETKKADGGKSPESVVEELFGLASEHEDFNTFKKAALAHCKGMSNFITWAVNKDNFEALRVAVALAEAGEEYTLPAPPPPKK